MNGTNPALANPKMTNRHTTKQMAVTLMVIVTMRRNRARSSGRYSSAPADMLMNARANCVIGCRWNKSVVDTMSSTCGPTRTP
jgi:hypothetical protein